MLLRSALIPKTTDRKAVVLVVVVPVHIGVIVVEIAVVREVTIVNRSTPKDGDVAEIDVVAVVVVASGKGRKARGII